MTISPAGWRLGGVLPAAALLLGAAAGDARPHPGLTVSRNQRSLVGADGRPFYWMGDTAWDLLYALSPSEVDDYLSVRRRQGFNAVMVQVLGGNPGARDRHGHSLFHPAANGRPDPRRPDPAFLAAARAKVAQIDGAGFATVLLLSWGNNVDAGMFDLDTAYAYGKLVGRTFGDLNVVFMLGGDSNPGLPAQSVWRAMAGGLDAGTPVPRLISYHPNRGSSAQWFGNAGWMDFNSIQSGHARYRPKAKTIAGIVRADYALDPPRPVIDLESGYENIPDGLSRLHPENEPVPTGERFDAFDVRVRAYQQLLSGAFGYMYGEMNVMSLWRPGMRVRWGRQIAWRQAINAEGAGDMAIVQKVRRFAGSPALAPADDLLVHSPVYLDYARITAACGPRRAVCLAYTPSGAPIRLRAGAIRPGARLRWLDPRSGAMRAAAAGTGPRGERLFRPPGSAPVAQLVQGQRVANDWLLMIDNRGEAA